MKINVKAKPYKGYIFFPRVIMLSFISNNKLEFGILGDFIAFATECDWDKRHPTYGCLTKPDEYLARRWGCDLSTVWRKKKNLKKAGFLREADNGLLRLHFIEWFEAPIAKELAKQEFADSQELIAKTHEIIASSQSKIADMQEAQGDNDPQSFNVSSKEDLSVGFSRDNSLSNEDIEEIARQLGEDD